MHATCVALGSAGVLLRGPSGAGKSDLALRLIDDGARLVADDQVDLTLVRGAIRAQAPATIAGKLEVRGLGIVTLPARASARLRLVVDLVAEAPRHPEPETCELLGIALPRVRLAAVEASAPAKVRLALATLRV